MREVYLDNNATTQPLLAVREAMARALDSAYGNPGSAHAAGERARVLIAQARAAIAALVRVTPEHIVFTGSGTEANNQVLRAAPSLLGTGCRVVTTAVEHSSILKTCGYLESQGVDVVVLPVDRLGLVDPAAVEKAATGRPALVSVQWANNETGVIQPVGSIVDACRRSGAVFHVDAIQAVGKMEVDLAGADVDFATLTAHKMHGPKGIGALYAKELSMLRPLLYGGGQERGLRAGTENTSAIAGFGLAAAARLDGLAQALTDMNGLRDALESRLLSEVPGVRVNGAGADRVCNTTSLLFPGADGQALVARLDQDGVRCSQSSACTNMIPAPSYVMTAMGLTEEEAYSCVRFSFSVLNADDDVDIAVRAIRKHLPAVTEGLDGC